MNIIACDVCGKVRECQVIKLTEAELEQAENLTPFPKPVYAYCQPCWRVLQDPEHATRLLQGSMLRAAGRVVPDKLAESIYTRLKEKIK
jgi:hypothetical protein